MNDNSLILEPASGHSEGWAKTQGGNSCHHVASRPYFHTFLYYYVCMLLKTNGE